MTGCVKITFMFSVILAYANATGIKTNVQNNDDLHEKFNQLHTMNEVLIQRLGELETKQKHLEDTVEHLTSENHIILERIHRLEEDNKIKDKIIANQQSQRQEDTASKQIHNNESDEDVIKYDQIKQEGTEPNSKETTTVGLVDEERKESQLQKGTIRKVLSHGPKRRKREILKIATNTVAFFATITPHEFSGGQQGSPIIFDNVVTNFGNSYHSHHGLFTAPVHGIYQFFVTIAFYNSETQQTYVALMHNGNILVQVRGLYANMGSHSVILELNAGDEIYIVFNSSENNIVLGDHYSSFSGLLLTEL